MLTGVIVSLFAIVLLAFLLIYKKEMIVRMFMLNMSAPANEFTQQLEKTADSIISRLEAEANQLEVLIEDAEMKIGMLSQQVEHANKIIAQLVEAEKRQDLVGQSDRPLVVAETVSAPVLSDVEEVLAEDDQSTTELATLTDDNKHIIKEPINMEKYRHIIAMADQGYTVTEIAKVTGMGKGEITLLLQLNK